MTESKSIASRLSWLGLVAYGLPGLPLAALGIPLYVYIPALYADDLALGLTAVGLVLLATRLADTAIDPLIGQLGDAWTTRFGRRRHWLVLAAPIACLSLWMLFRPPPGIGLAYLFVWSGLLYIAWTALQLPYTAWGAELSPDYHERSRITGARESFVILGTLIAIVLAPLALGTEAGRGEFLALNAAVLVILLPATVAIAVLMVAERPAPTKRLIDWRIGLALLARNRPFRRLIAAYLLNGIANGLPATLFLIFVQDLLMLSGSAGPMLAIYFFAGIVGMPLWLWLSQRWGKHRSWAIAMVWASIAFSTAPFLGVGDFWPYLALCVGSGLALGADLALPASIQADVVDVDTAEGGGQRTGLYFALWAMATKLALALAVGIAFPLLDLAGFRTGQANEPTALLVLALLYGGLPILFKLCACVLVWNFPLGADGVTAMRRRIDGKREQFVP